MPFQATSSDALAHALTAAGDRAHPPCADGGHRRRPSARRRERGGGFRFHAIAAAGCSVRLDGRHHGVGGAVVPRGRRRRGGAPTRPVPAAEGLEDRGCDRPGGRDDPTRCRCVGQPRRAARRRRAGSRSVGDARRARPGLRRFALAHGAGRPQLGHRRAARCTSGGRDRRRRRRSWTTETNTVRSPRSTTSTRSPGSGRHGSTASEGW